MKKVYLIISAIALSLSVANAQQARNGDGLNTMDGSGPFGARADMWANITDAAAGNETISNALTAINSTRATLAAARVLDAELTIAEFQAKHAATIETLKANIAEVQNWWRENRPDRPEPVVDEQYRNRFRINAQTLAQKRQQLRLMLATDPDNPECDLLRQQLGQLLGERKQLLRDQRRSGGRQSGDGNTNPGG